jgi:hypothetical protein
MRLSILCILCFIVSVSVSAQTLTNTDTLQHPVKVYKSPKTASILSAVLPGAGQVYNQKYWKVPVVYAALGTAVYYIDFNTKEYRAARTEYVARFDENESTVPSPDFVDTSDGQLELDKKFYKRMLDISYASLGIVYILNIVDASVDAHLFTFDVSEDLSLNWQPTKTMGLDNQQYTGVKLSLTF